MKRIGYLFDEVVSYENLRLAYLKASRGKRGREDQRVFGADLDWNLGVLREELIAGTYVVGEYHRFMIHDPKEREICAAPFRDRVLHHALMNVCEPWIEKWLIYDTYACRRGKGQVRAVARAQEYARKYPWFLKCDFRKYFDSIPHDGVRTMLHRRFKDARLLGWLEKILDSYETEPDTGLPIGNLTSQHFANLYLDPLDRLMGLPYVRYMDDFVFWGKSKEELRGVRDRVQAFSAEVLGLTLKESPFINRTQLGMDFLGMRVFPEEIRLSRERRARFVRKVRQYEWMKEEGWMDDAELQVRVTALTACTEQAKCWGWRRKVFKVSDVNVGLEPGSPGRVLEQQREELPFRESQQQHPVEQEQEQRLPPRRSCSTVTRPSFRKDWKVTNVIKNTQDTKDNRDITVPIGGLFPAMEQRKECQLTQVGDSNASDWLF